MISETLKKGPQCLSIRCLFIFLMDQIPWYRVFPLENNDVHNTRVYKFMNSIWYVIPGSSQRMETMENGIGHWKVTECETLTEGNRILWSDMESCEQSFRNNCCNGKIWDGQGKSRNGHGKTVKGWRWKPYKYITVTIKEEQLLLAW